MSTKLSARAANNSRRLRAGPRSLGLAFLLTFGFTGASARAEAPALDGIWSASALRSDWNIGDWGAACGPQPSGGNEAGGSVTITVQGSELVINGLGRSYATTQCWEQYPGLARVSHSSGTSSWRTTCKTSSGDARQATVVTQLSASGSRISFDETGQYQFLIKGQNCTASVRRTRSFSRAEAAAAPSSAAAEKPKRAPRCERVGLPERLEVRPSRKLMRPGESFTFRSNVVDKAGCSVGVAPVFRVQSGGGHVELTSVGKITVAEDAPESEVRLQASVGDRALGVVVEIVSRDRYDALLQQLQQEGGYLVNQQEKAQLQRAYWDEQGRRTADTLARPAVAIAAKAGINLPPGKTFFLVEEANIGKEHVYSTEKLGVVLAVFKAQGFDDALDKVRQIFETGGRGHSCGIYSFNDDHINRLALMAPVSRIMVRQVQSSSNAGTFTNGMPMTSSMGCGIWGGNITNENVALKHYMNVTWVSRPIPEDKPSEAELFGEFYNTHLPVGKN